MGTPVPSKANESKGIGSGPVTEYRLTAEEVAQRYGPPVPRKNKFNVEVDPQMPKPEKLTKEFLESELAAGKSAAQVERELGMQINTISYYMSKWELKSQHSPANKKTGDAPTAPDQLKPDSAKGDPVEVEKLRHEIERLKAQNVEVVALAGKSEERLMNQVAELQEKLAVAAVPAVQTMANIVSLPRTRRSMEIEVAGEQEEIVEELSAILAYLKATKGGKAFLLELRLGEVEAREVGNG